jgi:hypothetical protein
LTRFPVWHAKSLMALHLALHLLFGRATAA